MKGRDTKGTFERLDRWAAALVVLVTISAPPASAQTAPDLTLDLVNAGPVHAGMFGWNAWVENRGAAATSPGMPVVVQSKLSSSLTAISATGKYFKCAHDGSPKGGVFTCASLGPFTSSQHASIVFRAKPNGDSCSISHTTTVDPNNTIAEGDESNNSKDWAQTVTDGCPPDLTVQGSAPATIPMGSTLTYRLKVKNVGGRPAGAFALRAQLSRGVKYRDAGGAGFTCSHDGSATDGVVTCQVPGGLAGEGVEIAVNIGLNVTGSPCTVTNQAIVDSNNNVPEDNEQNNSAAPTSTTVSGPPCGPSPPTPPPGEMTEQTWNFNIDGNTEGWVGGGSVTSFLITGGTLRGTIVGIDPYVVGPVISKSAALSKIVIRLRNGTASNLAQIYFRTRAEGTWSESKHKDFAIQPQTGLIEYTIDMSMVPTWTGTIIQLRIDPATGANGTFDIDWIRIGTAPGSGAPPAPPPPPPPSETTEQTWNFNTAGNTEGWVRAGSITGLAVAGGTLRGTISGQDPYMYGPPISKSAALSKIVIRLRNGTASNLAQIYFRTRAEGTWSESKHKDFAIQPQSGLIEYTIDMSTVPTWTGTITQLRIDPATGANGTFDIDWIRIAR